MNKDNDMLLRIRLKYGNDIEYLEDVTTEELQAISNLEYLSSKYQNIMIHFTGIIDTKKILESYNMVLKETKKLRTNYFYKNTETPFKAIHSFRESDFMIQSLLEESSENAKKILQHAFAASLRDEYHAERDRMLRLKAFIKNSKEIFVLIQYNRYFLPKEEISQITETIFSGLKATKMELNLNESNQLQKRKTDKKSVQYWTNCNSYWPSNMNVPGEEVVQRKKGQICGLYQTLDSQKVKKINQYCQQHNISCEALLLYAWAKVFSTYHNEKRPVLLVAGNTQRSLQEFPVSVNCKDNILIGIEQIEYQFKKAREFCEITSQDLESIYNKTFTEYFHLVNHFINMKDKNRYMILVASEEAISNDFPLVCHYHIFDDEIGIHYVFHDNIFSEEVIERLQMLLLHMLDEVLDQKFAIFSKEEFLKDITTDEQKMKKARIAANALYLKNSALFSIRTAADMMKLAENSTVKRYVADDVILEASNLVNSFGIVGMGRVEECCTGMDGIQRTLRVMKPGDVLGMECLYMEDYSKHSYIAHGEEVTILWIDKKELIDFINEQPDNWRYFLAKTENNLQRLEKLWLLN